MKLKVRGLNFKSASVSELKIELGSGGFKANSSALETLAWLIRFFASFF